MNYSDYLIYKFELDPWVAEYLATASKEKLEQLLEICDEEIPPPLPANTPSIKISDSTTKDDERELEQADLH